MQRLKLVFIFFVLSTMDPPLDMTPEQEVIWAGLSSYVPLSPHKCADSSPYSEKTNPHYCKKHERCRIELLATMIDWTVEHVWTHGSTPRSAPLILSYKNRDHVRAELYAHRLDTLHIAHCNNERAKKVASSKWTSTEGKTDDETIRCVVDYLLGDRGRWKMLANRVHSTVKRVNDKKLLLHARSAEDSRRQCSEATKLLQMAASALSRSNAANDVTLAGQGSIRMCGLNTNVLHIVRMYSDVVRLPHRGICVHTAPVGMVWMACDSDAILAVAVNPDSNHVAIQLLLNQMQLMLFLLCLC